MNMVESWGLIRKTKSIRKRRRQRAMIAAKLYPDHSLKTGQMRLCQDIARIKRNNRQITVQSQNNLDFQIS